MTVGVDGSVIVACVHANHPRHALAATWLIQALAVHRLVVAHHSILEAYAVLTRLPGELRVTPSEAKDLLAATVRQNMAVADYRPDTIWALIEGLVASSVVGGRAYDGFVLEILRSSAVDAIVTLNSSHFRGLAPGIQIIDPAMSSE